MLQELETVRDIGFQVSELELLQSRPDTQLESLLEKYIRKNAPKLNSTPLGNLLGGLMLPFKDFPSPADIWDAVPVVVEDDPKIFRMSEMIVNYAYNYRYTRDGEVMTDIAHDGSDILPTTKTIALVQGIQDQNVVLGTFRTTAGDELEVFKFFECEGSWPHSGNEGKDATKPGELGRFGIHPIFDILNNDRSNPALSQLVDYQKKLILRRLWPFGINLLREQEVDIPYFVLSQQVRNFVISAGIIPQIVPNVRPKDSSYANSVRKVFAGYWKPDFPAEDQPSVYIAPVGLVPIATSVDSSCQK